MNKYLIESYLDNEVWDSYNGEFIEASNYENALKIYKKMLYDSGEFSNGEIETMKYRASAMTKYMVRKKINGHIDETFLLYDDAIARLYELGTNYYIEECEIGIGGEPVSESRWHFVEQ